MRTTRRVATGVLWIVLIVASGIAIRSSESFQDCEHNRKYHQLYDALHEEETIGVKAVVRLRLHASCVFETAHKNEGPLTLLATITIAGFTGTLWFATFGLWRSTDKLVNGAEDTAKRQLRAYVYPHSIELTKFSLTEPMEFAIKVRNSGSTPATNFECHAVAFFATLPLPDETVMPEPAEDQTIGRHSKGALFPGVERSIDCASIDLLTDEVIHAIMANDPQIAIYVAGDARYHDVFAEARSTTFCEYLNRDDLLAIIDDFQAGQFPADNINVRFTASHIHNNFT